MNDGRTDRKAYAKFTGPMRVSKAINSLKGILTGMRIDGRLTSGEIEALRCWTEDHREIGLKRPFSEIIDLLDAAFEDGQIDGEEIADILYVCNRMDPSDHYFKGVTAEMQHLHGLLAGIVADGEINDDELAGLSRWVGEAEHLKACWPFDEIESLLVHVARDKVVTVDDRQMLVEFLAEFTTMAGGRAISVARSTAGLPIGGLCAVCPKIVFKDRMFCFTGASERMGRKELASYITELGATFHPTIKGDVDYLIVGAMGNPCWTFSCYGRKVERAMGLRREGHPIQIIHEHDFWDATQSTAT